MRVSNILKIEQINRLIKEVLPEEGIISISSNIPTSLYPGRLSVFMRTKAFFDSFEDQEYYYNHYTEDCIIVGILLNDIFYHCQINTNDILKSGEINE